MDSFSTGISRCSSGFTTTRLSGRGSCAAGGSLRLSPRERFLTELTLDPPAARRATGAAAARRRLPDFVNHSLREGTRVAGRRYPERRRRLHPLGHGDGESGVDRGGAAPALRRDDPGAGTLLSRAASALLSNPAAPAWSWSRPRTAFALFAGGNPRPVYPRCRLAAFPHRLWAPRCPHSSGRHLHPASRVALRREERRSRLQTPGFPEPSSRLRGGSPIFPSPICRNPEISARCISTRSLSAMIWGVTMPGSRAPILPTCPWPGWHIPDIPSFRRSQAVLGSKRERCS